MPTLRIVYNIIMCESLPRCVRRSLSNERERASGSTEGCLAPPALKSPPTAHFAKTQDMLWYMRTPHLELTLKTKRYLIFALYISMMR